MQVIYFFRLDSLLKMWLVKLVMASGFQISLARSASGYFAFSSSLLGGVMVSTPAPHAANPGSIPGSGMFRRGQVVLLTRGVPRLPRGM